MFIQLELNVEPRGKGSIERVINVFKTGLNAFKNASNCILNIRFLIRFHSITIDFDVRPRDNQLKCVSWWAHLDMFKPIIPDHRGNVRCAVTSTELAMGYSQQGWQDVDKSF